MQKHLNDKAKEIAKHGRYGDDKLLHVSQTEIDGLASLLPGGKLPINPKTGLPEAFFFLPFLAALGAAAPAAAATGATAALGAGLAAGAGTAAAALPAAATAASALPAAAGGLAALGAAAPTAATALAPAAATTALSAAAPTATSLLGSGVAGTGAASGLGLPSMLGGVPMGGAALPASVAPVTAATSPLVTAPAAAAVPSAAITGPISTAGELAAGTTASGAKFGTGLGSLLGGIDGGKMLQYGALASMMLPKGGGGGSKDDGSSKDVGAKQYDRGDQSANTDDGSSGASGSEWKYFPGAHYYAEGGIASLSSGQMPGGQSGDTEGDKQLIDATVAAIQGQTPNAQAIIQQFIQQFGPEALQHLIQQVKGGQSQSDGLSDSVPAQINGLAGLQAPAQLSEGEHIVPADVVSHLGNGSTDAGSRQLTQMADRVRQQRGASDPQQINPAQVLPA